jgi:hypothetical protein
VSQQIRAVRLHSVHHRDQTQWWQLRHPTPDFPDAKSNEAFCIKVGTTVTFKSGSRNTGFVIDFGTENPIDLEGSIIGGSDRPITATAKHPGCDTYSVGACTPGTVYGMCGNADNQLIISAN